MKEATTYANAIAQKENEEALEAIRKSGKTAIYVLSDKEREEWRRALLGVHKEMEPRIGRDLLAEVYREGSVYAGK